MKPNKDTRRLRARDRICLSIEEAKDLAIQVWRIERLAETLAAGTSPLRYASRQLNELLLKHRVETVDLRGQEYMPGLAVDVIDVEAPKEKFIQRIVETIEPIVMIDGQVVHFGKVVVSGATETAHANL